MESGRKHFEKKLCDILKWVEKSNRFLIAQADKKARILIQANGLLTTILLANSLYIPPTRRLLLFPVGIQVLSSLIVISASLLVIKPRFFTTSLITDLVNHQKAGHRLTFAGTHFYRDLLFDVHHKATILAIKYKYLRFAFQMFIVGLILQLSATLIIAAVLR